MNGVHLPWARPHTARLFMDTKGDRPPKLPRGARLNLALGDVLRRRRLAAKLTQLPAMEALKIPHSIVSRIESGDRELSLIELVLLCEAYELSPTDVLAEALRQLQEPRR